MCEIVRELKALEFLRGRDHVRAGVAYALEQHALLLNPWASHMLRTIRTIPERSDEVIEILVKHDVNPRLTAIATYIEGLNLCQEEEATSHAA